MKNIFKTITTQTTICLLFTLTGLTFITSCKKHDDNDFESTVTANVRLVNTSTDAGPSTLYITDALRTSAAVNNGASSGYSQTYVGDVSADAKNAANSVLASANTSFAANNNYTFFLTGSSGSYSLLSLHDDTQAASSGKAKIRFVQASSGLTSANLLIGGTALFSAQAFKSVTDYSEVTAGTLVFNITNTGSNTTLATASFNAQAGKNYTVYTYGTSGGSGSNALTVNVLTNN